MADRDGQDELVLVIADKRLSSWSLRPWLLLKAIGVPFREVSVRLDRPDTAAAIAPHSPSGRVPVLKAGPLAIWDSLAIAEYLAERFPEAGLWPADAGQRALARAVSAEMHSGFAELRRDFAMDLKRPPGRRVPQGKAAAQVARIAGVWSGLREPAPAGGPFLFGRFSIADAMYAPVAFRFDTYRVDLPPAAAAYRDTLLGLPAMREWWQAAQAED